MSYLRAAAIISGIVLAAHERALANGCALPITASAGYVSSSLPPNSMTLTVGAVSGVSASSKAVLSMGYPSRMVGAYKCFLSTGAPSIPTALPGTRSVVQLVPSPMPIMQLEWMSVASDLPITYQVYFGTAAAVLTRIVSGLAVQSETQRDLSYLMPYYWQVSAIDPFGRSASSPIYTFSIAPVADHAIAAPNPFHPGYGSISMMFSMSGPGSAMVEIYSMPDARKLVNKRLEGLQDGVNIFTYDGRDNGGRLLPNGVYVVRLIKEGSRGNSAESFKIVSAR